MAGQGLRRRGKWCCEQVRGPRLLPSPTGPLGDSRQAPHPGLRHSWMSDTQAFTWRASAVSRMYSEGPSTYEDKRRPTGHFQVQRLEATVMRTRIPSPSPLLPGKLQLQGHPQGTGRTGTSFHAVPGCNVLRKLSPQHEHSKGAGAQSSYLNHKRVLPVRHLQGRGCPHVRDGRAGNAESRPRCLGGERDQEPNCWCAGTTSHFPPESHHLSFYAL